MFWIWANEPTADNEAMIYGTPEVIEELNLEFDEGIIVNKNVPDIIVVQDEDSQGELTDNLIASGVNGLLFGSKLRTLLESIGVDNIQYFPCQVVNPVNNSANNDYMIANIIGRVKCVDLDGSEIDWDPDNPDVIEYIDSLKLTDDISEAYHIFRTHEVPQMIVVSDLVRNALIKNQISGIKFYQPAEYIF